MLFVSVVELAVGKRRAGDPTGGRGPWCRRSRMRGRRWPIRPSSGVAFERYCRSCPLASRCTTAVRARKLTIHIHEQSLRAARTLAKDPNWQAEYRQHRPMVERSIAWLTRNNRKLRYRGTAKNDHWLHHRVAALNLWRLITMGLTHTGTTLGHRLTTPAAGLAARNTRCHARHGGATFVSTPGSDLTTPRSGSRHPAPKAPYSADS